MDEKEFLKLEYQTLREEIKESKARMFRVLALGVPAFPLAQFAASRLDSLVIGLFLPLIPISLAHLYLAENHGVMRCGTYIRTRIEPRLSGSALGWEHWLESGPGGAGRRSVDIFTQRSALVLFAGYFLLSSVLNFLACRDEYPGSAGPYFVFLLYGAAAVLLIPAFLRTARVSTKRDDEASGAPAPARVPVAHPRAIRPGSIPPAD